MSAYQNTSDYLCHCGQPLHYSNPLVQLAVESLIAVKGEYIDVVGPDRRRWKVQRHYIALHGIKADDLHRLGFEEIT